MQRASNSPTGEPSPLIAVPVLQDRECFFPIRAGPVEPLPPQEVLDAIAAEKARSTEPVREFLPSFGAWSDALDVILGSIQRRGILFLSEYLRVGYFWGGDGEKNVKVDIIKARAHVVDEDEVGRAAGRSCGS